MTEEQIKARQDELYEELRQLDCAYIDIQKRKMREEASRGPHRFAYYDSGGFDPETQLEMIPCYGCGEVRGHANHRADLVSIYGEEAYNRYYGIE